MVKRKKAKKKVVKKTIANKKKNFYAVNYLDSIQTDVKVDPRTKLGHIVWLSVELKGMFDKKLKKLPKAKQKLINAYFLHSGLWDDMTADMRQKNSKTN